jgi:hypothetical protein
MTILGNATGSCAAAGALTQMIALGAMDGYLTSGPSHTFWRARIQKCTNAAYESVQQGLNGAPVWGGSQQVSVNRTGDLIYWMYVVLDIPGIAPVEVPSSNASMAGVRPAGMAFPYTDPCDPCGDDDAVDVDDDDAFFTADCSDTGAPYCHWVNEIGHAALARVCISIGGQVVDTLYSHYMHMWEELSGHPGKRLEEMIGKRTGPDAVQQLIHDSSKDRRLYVPLPFFYTRHSGNALPLVSLSFHSIQLHIQFSELREMIRTSGPYVSVCVAKTGNPITNNDLNACIDTTYVYLDQEERDKFSKGNFHQLATQVQQFSCSSKDSSVIKNLNFNHPSIELIWAFQRKCLADQNHTFDYSGPRNTDPIKDVSLLINNMTRFSREAPYFRLKVPYEVHTSVPRNFVYNYAFSLQPESHQPSGSLNFSRIDNVTFSATMSDECANTEMCMYVFARNWNIMRYSSGLAGLKYAN